MVKDTHRINHRVSSRMNSQPERMRGAYLGLQHVGNRCAAWFLCVTLRTGAGSVADSVACLWIPPLAGLLYLASIGDLPSLIAT